MELEEMKVLWQEMSQQVEKQKSLTDKLIIEMTQQKYAQKFEYPLILKEDKNLSVAISQAELNQIKTLDELISQVKIVSH